MLSAKLKSDAYIFLPLTISLSFSQVVPLELILSEGNAQHLKFLYSMKSKLLLVLGQNNGIAGGSIDQPSSKWKNVMLPVLNCGTVIDMVFTKDQDEVVILGINGTSSILSVFSLGFSADSSFPQFMPKPHMTRTFNFFINRIELTRGSLLLLSSPIGAHLVDLKFKDTLSNLPSGFYGSQR
jgi:hypothetical protein